MWKGDSKKVFESFFEANCFHKKKCELNPLNMMVDGKQYKLPEMISETCTDNMFGKLVTSQYLLSVASCLDEILEKPYNISKQSAG